MLLNLPASIFEVQNVGIIDAQEGTRFGTLDEDLR